MELPYETFPIVGGPARRHAQWPPRAVSVEPLGHLVESSGINFPRDIGRSSTFGDAHIIFNFGDTLAANETGQYAGTISSTMAVAMDTGRLPTVTYTYPDELGNIPSFIPLLENEKEEYGKRATLWCFGGIVETGSNASIGDIAAGWVFYQKGTHYYLHADEHVFEYTGVARVGYDLVTKRILVKRIENPLVLFKVDEPRFGTFSTVRQGDVAHLFGHSSDEQAVMLARVNTRYVTNRSQYTYWDGKKYQSNIAKAKPVLNNMEHGAIYRSKLFEQGKGRDWVFIGCSRFRDSKVKLGVSAKLEGPFTIVRLINAEPLTSMPVGSYMYCMYPHPWAFKEEEGQLMITWSEGKPNGNVVAVKVQFAMTMEVGLPSDNMKERDNSGEGNCVIL